MSKFTQADIDKLAAKGLEAKPQFGTTRNYLGGPDQDGNTYEMLHPVPQESIEATIKVKPMSINKAYTGKRYKTPAYRVYCKDVVTRLRSAKLKPGKYQVFYRFGLSNAAADWDNPVKPFQDIIATFFRFNDKAIRRAVVEIDDVKPGGEYVHFRIEKIN